MPVPATRSIVSLPRTTSTPVPIVETPTVIAPSPTLPVQLTQTLVAPTANSLPSPTSTGVASVSAPFQMLGRINLLDLPGEGRAPVALAQVGNQIYVANRNSDSVAVISDGKATTFIPTADEPVALAPNQTGQQIFVGTYETPTLGIISGDKLTKQVPVGGRVNSLAFSDDVLFVALDNAPIVELRDTNLEKKAEIKLSSGFGVSFVTVDEPRKILYAATYGKIHGIDLATLTERASFDVPYLYGSFVVNPRDGVIWAGMYDEKASQSFLSAFAPDGKQLAKIAVGTNPQPAAIDKDGRLYVLDNVTQHLSVVDTSNNRVVGQAAVGEDPTAAVADPTQGRLYVANGTTDNLTVIDPETLHTDNVIPLAPAVSALLADNDGGRLYAANSSTNSVFVIQGGRVVANIPVGINPLDLARDPKTHRLYVASHADGVLTTIDENSLKVTASDFVTRSLSTVAVDPVNRRLFAGSSMYNLDTMEKLGEYLAHGLTLGSLNPAELVRVNPALQKIYALAYNGVPGSNSRTTLFGFLYSDLATSIPMPGSNNANISQLLVDQATNNLFVPWSHPLAATNGLDVYDGGDKLVHSLALNERVTGISLNSSTNHLFLSHAFTTPPYPGSPTPRDDSVQILDARTLGLVDWLHVPGAPGPSAVLGDKFYVAGKEDGVITEFQDLETSQPSAPTRTFTPSPFPSSTPTSSASAFEPGLFALIDMR